MTRAQARQQLVQQHRAQMQQRASQQGVALSPDGTEIVRGDHRRDQDRTRDGTGGGPCSVSVIAT